MKNHVYGNKYSERKNKQFSWSLEETSIRYRRVFVHWRVSFCYILTLSLYMVLRISSRIVWRLSLNIPLMIKSSVILTTPLVRGGSKPFPIMAGPNKCRPQIAPSPKRPFASIDDDNAFPSLVRSMYST